MDGLPSMFCSLGFGSCARLCGASLGETSFAAIRQGMRTWLMSLMARCIERRASRHEDGGWPCLRAERETASATDQHCSTPQLFGWLGMSGRSEGLSFLHIALSTRDFGEGELCLIIIWMLSKGMRWKDLP